MQPFSVLPAFHIDDYPDVRDEPGELFWRAKAYVTTDCATVYFERWRRVRTTPKGMWVCLHYEYDLEPKNQRSRRFILAEAKNQFVRPTRAEAYTDLIHRTRHRVAHAEVELARAKYLDQHLAVNKLSITSRTYGVQK